MEIQTKNKVGLWGFGILFLAAGGYVAATHWPASWRFGKARGVTVETALAMDLKGMETDKFLKFLGDLNFEGSTHSQRQALTAKLRAYFEQMSLLEKYAMMIAMRSAFEADQRSGLVGNTRVIMQEYWSMEMKRYLALSPADRMKMLDERIDEQVAMENLQKIQDAAKALFGGSKEKRTEVVGIAGMPDLDKFRPLIADAIHDAIVNTPPADRAGASQFILDMRARRLARGLPVAF